MAKEDTLEVLKETTKKIADLKNFNVPVILEIIENYINAGVESYLIEQQKLQLKKIYATIDELEAKAERLSKILE
ncbi:MAG: hypothetical protein VB084_03460 [Syntrophomonadaceae bacterium]|nr:hypothetical protein [Syntrophomonadaceae bacterium]